MLPALSAILQVAAAAIALSAILGIWLGHYLQRKRTASALAGAPLLLPPTIICAYFLVRPFTMAVAVAAAAVHWIPALARSARLTFQALDCDVLHAARIAGASEWRVFWRIVLPLSARPLLSAAAWGFALTASEYAAVLWIAQSHFGRP